MTIPSKQNSSANDSDLTGVLQRFRAPTKLDLASLLALWRARDPDTWSGNPEIYRLLGERIISLGEPLLAYDVISEGIKSSPTNAALRQLLALALARSGAAESANAVLMRLYQEGHRDEETLGLLARTYKDLASEATDPSEANRYLRRAYEFYTQAYQATGGYWSGINVATLAQALGESQQAMAVAREVARKCVERLRAAKGERYWLLSTLGETALLLRQWSEAEDWYSQAFEEGRGNWGSLQATRRNARLLLRHLGEDPDRIEQFFRFPSVVIFTGHLVDRPNRAMPRFPPDLEPAVKEAIRERLKKLNGGFGYASAACGSDILFHEVLRELHGETHVVLPFDRGAFIRESVDIIPGADWRERYEQVVAHALDTQEASMQTRKVGHVSFEFGNLLVQGLARGRAEQLGTKLVGMAVWNGERGDGPGGTADTVKQWRKGGLTVEIIDLAEILRRAGVPSTGHPITSPQTLSSPTFETTPDFAAEIRALLFSDVERFSRLTDEEVPSFVRHFLGLVGELSVQSPNPPLMKNTWGDGLYFVFSNVRDAGQFALDLRDRVKGTDWAQKGLPGLDIRIGLHAGPVYACTDPVTQRTNYIGAHVSRAARIEPITPTGQVYASQTFAALAAVEQVREFRCEYVGQTPMAKHYGTFPTYVVRRGAVTA